MPLLLRRLLKLFCAVLLLGVSVVSVAQASTVSTSQLAHLAGSLSWSNQTDPAGQTTLQSVSCPTDSFCVAVGQGGTILTTSDGGSTWTPQTSPTAQTLSGVSCASQTTCAAVGYSGTLIVTGDGGTSWAVLPPPISYNLNGVTCPTSTQCFAVGFGSVVSGSPTPSSTWSTVESQQQLLFGIDCISPTQCTAVGSSGAVIYTTDGTTWTSSQSGTSTNLFSVSCANTTYCVAVGGTVGVETTNGTSWSVISNLGTGSTTLQSVSCVSGGQCWIGGLNPGTVVTSAGPGQTFSQQMPNASTWLFGVSCPDSSHCWGVGAGVITAGVGAPTTINTNAPVYNADAPDPDIISVGGTYYAFTTGTAVGNYIQLLSSTSLSAWTVVGSALPSPPSWEEVNTQEAPGVFSLGGQFIMYYAAIDQSTNVRCLSMATSATVTGPYVDSSSGPLLCDSSLGGVLDPQPFTDTNGNSYLYWKSNDGVPTINSQIWVAPIGLGGIPNFSAETSLIVQDQPNTIEAPFMYLNNGTYYLFYSEGVWHSSNYAVGYATCSSATGPCTTIEVASLLVSNSLRLGPGGECLFTDSSGNTWMAYAAWNGPTSNFSYSSGDFRSLWLAQVTFSGTTPVVGGGSSPPPTPQGPSISSISPTSGPSAGGTTVTISGSNLSSVTGVMFGTLAASSFTTVSNSEVQAVSPPGTSGTIDITATNSGSTSALSCADQFTYTASSSSSNPTGYRIVTSGGQVYGCGGDPIYGTAPSGTQNVAAIADTPDNGGYWLATTTGDVFPFGDATFFGSSGQINPGLPAGGSNAFTPVKPIVGILATADGKGYWMVAADGGVFAFGDAGFVGSVGSIALSGSAIAIVH